MKASAAGKATSDAMAMRKAVSDAMAMRKAAMQCNNQARTQCDASAKTT